MVNSSEWNLTVFCLFGWFGWFWLTINCCPNHVMNDPELIIYMFCCVIFFCVKIMTLLLTSPCITELSACVFLENNAKIWTDIDNAYQCVIYPIPVEFHKTKSDRHLGIWIQVLVIVDWRLEGWLKCDSLIIVEMNIGKTYGWLK